jgi:murein DD-endopeptidase MepM/ murein hydrolase activator NlpD
MKPEGSHSEGIAARLRILGRHLGQGFSFIIAPHGTGTTVTLNLPGRLVIVLVIGVVALIVGLAFVGVTYTKLALLAFETGKLKTENRNLRMRNRKIEKIEEEIARIDQMRSQIEAWAGLAPEDTASGDEAQVVLVPRMWPRRYTYAILGPSFGPDSLRAPGMIAPVAGWVSRRFIEGGADLPAHPGIDIAAPTGTPVKAALDGTVSKAGWDDIYGNLIMISHNDSLSTIYGHNAKILVKEGEYVSKGQIIATVGSTGRSTAPHLHFEVLKNGEPRNPEDYVIFKSE